MYEDAEKVFRRVGLPIEEFDFGREDEPDVIGFRSLEWLDLDHTKYVARLLVRPGTSAEDRATFAEWCRGAPLGHQRAGGGRLATARVRRWLAAMVPQAPDAVVGLITASPPPAADG